MKPDIQNSTDIKLLLDTFYSKVLKDETIGYIFNEVAKINVTHHMPILYSFWESVLLGVASYKGNAMLKHIELNKKEPLTDAHFTQWKKNYFLKPSMSCLKERLPTWLKKKQTRCSF